MTTFFVLAALLASLLSTPLHAMGVAGQLAKTEPSGPGVGVASCEGLVVHSKLLPPKASTHVSVLFDAVKPVVDRHGLGMRLAELNEHLNRVKLGLDAKGWAQFRDLVDYSFHECGSRAEVAELLNRLRELAARQGAGAKLKPVAASGKALVLGDVDPAGIEQAQNADGQGNFGYRVSAGTAKLLGRVMEFAETIYLPPGAGKTVAQWAGEVYGVAELQPFRKTDKLNVGEAATIDSLAKWLRTTAAESGVEVRGHVAAETAAMRLLSGESLEIQGSGSIELDPRDPSSVLRTRDVTGGFRRIFLHPTNPKKLIKVYDPSLVPEMSPVLFAKMIQWDVARIRYFQQAAAEAQSAGRDVPFRLNGMSLDPAKTQRGIAEVDRIDADELGKKINIDEPVEKLPAYIRRFFVGLKVYDEPLIKLGHARYGEDFTFSHRVYPDSVRHVQRFSLTAHETGLFVMHGLDYGNPGEYENIRVLVGSDGREYVVFIDQ